MEYLLQLAQSPSPGPVEITCKNFPPACLTDISKLSSILLPIIYLGAAVLLLGLLIRAAFLYIKSEGDAGQVKTAQQTATYAILGIIVVFLAYFLVRFVSYVLDIPFFL